MGYSRLFAILAHLKHPVRMRALATCCGMDETKVGFILMRNQVDFGVRFDDEGYVYTEAMNYGNNA